jgi:hypothetical protein
MENLNKIDVYNSLMESCFKRCKLGKIYDQNCKPFSEKFLLIVLSYLEEQERYEDCIVMNNIIKKHFNHELNFKK